MQQFKDVDWKDNIKIFCHHIYEYKKGLRNLVLCTMNASDLDFINTKLSANNISSMVWEVNDSKINIFFGHNDCIKSLKLFNTKNLAHLSPEEDFILGIMLGYDRIKQSERYVERKSESINSEER